MRFSQSFFNTLAFVHFLSICMVIKVFHLISKTLLFHNIKKLCLFVTKHTHNSSLKFDYLFSRHPLYQHLKTKILVFSVRQGKWRISKVLICFGVQEDTAMFLLFRLLNYHTETAGEGLIFCRLRIISVNRLQTP